MRRIWPLSLLMVAGCSQSVENMSCDDIANQAVIASKGTLIKIMRQTVASRDAKATVCRGIGVYADGTEIPTRFSAYLDEENALMVKFDTEEATAAAQAAAMGQIDRELQRNRRDFEREVGHSVF